MRRSGRVVGRTSLLLALLSGLGIWLTSAPARAAMQQAIDNPHGDISIACSECHTTSNWQKLKSPLPFDHAKTGFPLQAGHGKADCKACHESLIFQHVPTACADCHGDPHRGELGFGCETCHTPQGWQDRQAMFVFHFTTTFPLSGAHARVDCDSCHQAQPPFEYANTPTDCYSCHASNYRSTTEPDHETLGFPTDCESCHTVDDWQSELFADHDSFFPLTGAHGRLGCNSCHASGFAGTPTDCYDCHAADYNDTKDPDHLALGFPLDCELCHSTQNWGDTEFVDHDQFWPLTGAHGPLDCTSCHVDGVFAGTPTDCSSCHIDAFNDTSDPDHQASGFSTDCELCHTTSKWSGATFDHQAIFPLRGKHKQLDCDACHVDGVFAGTPTDCYSCHKMEYDDTTDPDHAAAGFPFTCETCHTEQRWSGAVFDHDAFFPLVQAHSTLDCATCHADGVYAGTPTDCYSCHQKEYDKTKNPNHMDAGFPTNCEACHDQRRWKGAVFDHDAFFQLQGAHVNLDCDSCHVNGVFAGTPTDCVSCHQTQYDDTTNPNHAAAGFPTDCETCHTQDQWEGAVFDHDAFFQLQGAHVNLSCDSCHVNEVFAGTPTDCVSCHQTQYDNTTNPNHAASGFPTDCELCHGQNQWEGASFQQHDSLYFPIYSGKHRNEWNSCADCHMQANDFTAFECIFCHEHNQADTDNKHSDVGGYQYASTACYQCHPTGDSEGGGDRRGWALAVPAPVSTTWPDPPVLQWRILVERWLEGMR